MLSRERGTWQSSHPSDESKIVQAGTSDVDIFGCDWQAGFRFAGPSPLCPRNPEPLSSTQPHKRKALLRLIEDPNLDDNDIRVTCWRSALTAICDRHLRQPWSRFCQQKGSTASWRCGAVPGSVPPRCGRICDRTLLRRLRWALICPNTLWIQHESSNPVWTQYDICGGSLLWRTHFASSESYSFVCNPRKVLYSNRTSN